MSNSVQFRSTRLNRPVEPTVPCTGKKFDKIADPIFKTFATPLYFGNKKPQNIVIKFSIIYQLVA